MREFIPENLIRLARATSAPLYLVGGSVRDYLCGFVREKEDLFDLDICAPISAEEFVSVAQKHGFTVHSVYKNTGTVKLTDGEGGEYEFASFRFDEYIRGEHTPSNVCFTKDIKKDARRRDFTANAVYYDLKEGVFVDPLGGIEDIKNKTLRTVRDSDRVFSEDGLRLMRLARQAACLGFSIEEQTKRGASENCTLIRDIAAERIGAELSSLLAADEKYGVKGGAYHGLQVLNDTGVLKEILPDLALGDKMAQRSDYHDYDVLQHCLRCVLYAPAHLRLTALLHDVGKPYCVLRDGNAYRHAEEGARIAKEIMLSYKFPKKEAERTSELILWHMLDMRCDMGERKIRRFFTENYPIVEDLLLLKQADFSACKDDLSIAPTVLRWRGILDKMKEEKTPFSLSELAISGLDLQNAGIQSARIGKVLRALLRHCACFPNDNERERLLTLSKGFEKEVQGVDK